MVNRQSLELIGVVLPTQELLLEAVIFESQALVLVLQTFDSLLSDGQRRILGAYLCRGPTLFRKIPSLCYPRTVEHRHFGISVPDYARKLIKISIPGELPSPCIEQANSAFDGARIQARSKSICRWLIAEFPLQCRRMAPRQE